MSELKELEKKVDLLIDYITCPESDFRGRETLFHDLIRLKSEVMVRVENNKPLNIFVEDLLADLGIPSNIMGYNYLTTAVVLIMDSPDLIHNVCKGLYPEIAKIYSTTSYSVERGIRYAVETLSYKGDSNIIQEIFGAYQNGMSKFSNTDFISRLVRVVKREMVSDHAT